MSRIAVCLWFNGEAEEAARFYVSIFPDAAEVDHYWDVLTADGGSEGQYGWLKDRFGVSWQVVPDGLGAVIADPDRARAGRAMQALFGMRKLDLAATRAAAEGDAK